MSGEHDASTNAPRRPRPLRSRLALLALAALTGLAVGLAIDVGRAGGPLAWLARHGVAAPYSPQGRLVDAGGRRLYLDCRGRGDFTVILDAGLGSDAGGWGVVLDEIAGFARVCAYDRPGFGRSDRRGLHTVADTTDDLRTALEAAGERPPFIVAGHSLGGVYGQVFEGRYSSDVAGLVMIDAFFSDLNLERRVELPAEFLDLSRRDAEQTAAQIAQVEDLDWPASFAQLDASWPHRQPSVVLAVDQHFRFVGLPSATQEALIAAWNAALLDRFPRGEIVIASGSSHLIHLDRPDLVVDAIRRVIARAAG